MSQNVSQVPRTTRPPKRTLRVSQIVVQLVLVNEHDAPVQPEPVVFVGDENGTAAEQLAAWLELLPAQLETAAEPDA